jgi:hypothetical protein
MTKTQRVTFVGGPLCGKVKKVPVSKLCQYVGYETRGKEYLYQHCYKTVNGKAFKAEHRYVFLGHQAQLPGDVKELD